MPGSSGSLRSQFTLNCRVGCTFLLLSFNRRDTRKYCSFSVWLCISRMFCLPPSLSWCFRWVPFKRSTVRREEISLDDRAEGWSREWRVLAGRGDLYENTGWVSLLALHRISTQCRKKRGDPALCLSTLELRVGTWKMCLFGQIEMHFHLFCSLIR